MFALPQSRRRTRTILIKPINVVASMEDGSDEDISMGVDPPAASSRMTNDDLDRDWELDIEDEIGLLSPSTPRHGMWEPSRPDNPHSRVLSAHVESRSTKRSRDEYSPYDNAHSTHLKGRRMSVRSDATDFRPASPSALVSGSRHPFGIGFVTQSQAPASTAQPSVWVSNSRPLGARATAQVYGAKPSLPPSVPWATTEPGQDTDMSPDVSPRLPSPHMTETATASKSFSWGPPSQAIPVGRARGRTASTVSIDSWVGTPPLGLDLRRVTLS